MKDNKFFVFFLHIQARSVTFAQNSMKCVKYYHR